MYIPKYYQMNDFEKIKDFMIKNNFITIVTNNESIPIATHLPINIEDKGDALFITGHFAKANKQWQTIDGNENVLIIFHGPHAYISSTWYEKEDVPTWDYQSIHAYGQGNLLSEDELIEDLSNLLNRYERDRINGSTWDNMTEKTKRQIKGIVGFKVKVEKIDAAYKLSQNRSELDKENIIKNLYEHGDSVDKKLASEIKNN